MKKWLKPVVFASLLLGIAGVFYFSLKDKPIAVDVGQVTRAPLSVTIDGEGIARVKELYSVSSPIAGHLSRTILQEGDPVKAWKSVVASIHPLDPPFLNERTRTELEAAVDSARSAVELAEVEKQRMLAALTLARADYNRALTLKKTNDISQSSMDKALSELKLQQAQLESSNAAIRLRKTQLASAQARLTPANISSTSALDTDCCIEIVSPADGVILTMHTRSEQALAAGTRIADIGDPNDLEIVVDLLSSDIANIRVGSPAQISDWGGGQVVSATVERINPAAFTKVSALGIEEQRVNVVLALDERAPGLGHGFRVLVRLSVWSENDVLQIPMGALFRSGEQWSVFQHEEGLAKLVPVTIGQMNNRSVQITEGLSVNESVVLYPNDLIESGIRIEIRSQGES